MQLANNSKAPVALCLFCATGREVQVAREISNEYGVKAILPKRVLQEKHDKKWVTIERPLLQGYIFIFLEEATAFSIRKFHYAYKILGYGGGSHELVGADYEYAMWLYQYNGEIGLSQALNYGDGIKVTKGPLLDYEGMIVKVDKHKRRALVDFNFDGVCRKVWLYFEWVEGQETIKQAAG